MSQTNSLCNTVQGGCLCVCVLYVCVFHVLLVIRDTHGVHRPTKCVCIVSGLLRVIGGLRYSVWHVCVCCMYVPMHSSALYCVSCMKPVLYVRAWPAVCMR